MCVARTQDQLRVGVAIENEVRNRAPTYDKKIPRFTPSKTLRLPYSVLMQYNFKLREIN